MEKLANINIDKVKALTFAQILLTSAAAAYTIAPDFIPGTIDDATLNAAITFVDVLLQKAKQ